MYKGRYVLGVCMTKLYEVHNRRFLKCLKEEAEKENLQIMVFHSFYDFFYDDAFEHGSATVFSLINYDYVDALVIMPDDFKTDSVMGNIIEEARKHDVPVISIDREHPVDVCIMPEQGRAFGELVRHLIEVHKIKRPFFMSGVKGSEDSVKREEAYKKVLGEYNIPVDEENYLGYGDFWAGPTIKVLDEFFSSGKERPDAIICANDSMAIAVCQYLLEHDINVPEDIIVTGYDGVDPEDLMVPAITTCENDYRTYAEHTVDSAIRLIEKGKAYSLWHVPLTLKLTESCGCKKKDYKRYAKNSGTLYNFMSTYEHYDLHWMQMPVRIIDDPTFENIKKILLQYLPDGTALCISSGLVGEDGLKDIRMTGFSDRMTVISAKDIKGRELLPTSFPTRELLPEGNGYNWDSIVVFTAINFKDRVLGYVASNFEDLRENSRGLHKFVLSLNSVAGVIGGERN